MLVWRHQNGVLAATGHKGEYRIRHTRAGFALEGFGHDGLTMIALVPARRFDTLDQAKHRADRLERVRAVEWQVSGT